MHRARLFAKRRAVSLSPPSSSSSRRSNAAPPAPHRVSDRPRRPLFSLVPSSHSGASSAKPAKGAKGKGKDKKGKDEEEDEGPQELPVSDFVLKMQACTEKFCQVWQDRDETTNFSQKYDAELIREALRPGVRDEIRVKEVDEVRRDAYARASTTESDSVVPLCVCARDDSVR